MRSDKTKIIRINGRVYLVGPFVDFVLLVFFLSSNRHIIGREEQLCRAESHDPHNLLLYIYIYMLVESQKTSIFLVVYTDSVN